MIDIATVVIAKNQDHPTGIAVDSTYVYWTNTSDQLGKGSVMRLKK